MDDISPKRFEELAQMHSTWLVDAEGDKKPTMGQQLQLNMIAVRGAVLTNHNFTCANLNNCHIEDCSFTACSFASSELIQSACVRCNFDSCGFQKADLRGIDASGCSFRRCNFTRADLTDSLLFSTNCSECVFDWGWLIRTDLRNATLEEAQLVGSRINRAKLYNTRRFRFGRVEKVEDAKVDFSESGDGSLLIDWPELMSRLSIG